MKTKSPKAKSTKEKELSKWLISKLQPLKLMKVMMNDHLTELRNRLGIALVAFIVIFLVSVALAGHNKQ